MRSCITSISTSLLLLSLCICALSEQVVQDDTTVTADLRLLQKKTIELEGAKAAAEKRHATLEQQVVTLEGKIATHKEELAAERASSAAAKQLHEEAVAALDKAQTVLQTTQRAKEDLKEALKAANARAEAAVGDLASHRSHLQQAQGEAGRATRALLAAEQRADAAEELLRRSRNYWLPHWLETLVNRVLAVVLPLYGRAKASVVGATSRAATGTQGPGWAASTRDWASKAQGWGQAAWASTSESHKATWKSARNLQAKASKHPLAQKLSSAYNSFLKQPQVVSARSAIYKQQRALERWVTRLLRGHPVLAPYARRPYTTLACWLLVLLPVLIIFQALSGSGRKAKRAPRKGASHTPVASTSKGKAASSAKPSKAAAGSRRISVGEDSIRVP